MERSELGEQGQLVLDGVVDEHRLAEGGAAVDDAMRDGLHCRTDDVLERRDGRRGLVGGDEVQLQARRAGVDD